MNNISTETKQDQTQLSNTMEMCLENTLTNQKENWKSYHAICTSKQFNVSFHFRNMFYFTAV